MAGRFTFRQRVLAIVRAVPRGRVVTYGQVALLAGKRHGAREVGWIAHAGGAGIPWQRVVNREGGLARGFAGGREEHRRALRRDGVRVGPDGRVDLRRYLWWPDARTRRRLGIA
jgi:methylated-DNA-protein-cysteine methyltransferase-like protein